MGNLAGTYSLLGRNEEALRVRRDEYSRRLKLSGEQDRYTLQTANNLAFLLVDRKRFEESKSLMRKTIPVARRVCGMNDEITLKMRAIYAKALYRDDGATLDDLREAVQTSEDTTRTARRVFGGTHPLVAQMQMDLRNARAALRAREETQPPGDA